MLILETIRAEFKSPMAITSGFRCPTYNNRISKTGPDGPHTTGKAADILISGDKAFLLLTLAIHYRMLGIGLKQRGPWNDRFMHLDSLDPWDAPRPRVWTY